MWGSRRDAHDVPKLMLMEAWQARLAFYPLVQKVIKTCRKRQIDRLLIESRANGISVAQEILRLASEEEFGVQLVDPRKTGGDKVARAYLPKSTPITFDNCGACNVGGTIVGQPQRGTIVNLTAQNVPQTSTTVSETMVVITDLQT